MEITHYSYSLKETKKIILSSKAKDYIEKVLDEFSHSSLSDILLKRLKSSDGVVFTLLPKNIDFKETINYKWTVLYPRTLGRSESYLNTNAAISEFVDQYLSSNKSNICLIEDLTQKPEHPCRIINGVKPIVFDDRCYYMLTSLHKKDQIRRVIGQTRTWAFIAALSRLDKQTLELTNDDISSISHDLEMVIVDAFDDNGYIIWEKERGEEPLSIDE